MGTLNIGISMNQGDDFYQVVQINSSPATCTSPAIPLNITGYSFLGEMKDTTEADQPVIAEFAFTILNQSTNEGQVAISLSNTITSTLEVSTSDGLQKTRLSTPYVFDVKMLDTSSKVTRILQGLIYVSPQVTQEGF